MVRTTVLVHIDVILVFTLVRINSFDVWKRISDNYTTHYSDAFELKITDLRCCEPQYWTKVNIEGILVLMLAGLNSLTFEKRILKICIIR